MKHKTKFALLELANLFLILGYAVVFAWVALKLF